MLYLVSLFCAVFLALSTSAEGACGIGGGRSRVIGGIDAQVGAWPWQVGLLKSSNQQFFCGGSLVAENWVVTAAHCISSRRGSDYTILLGAHNRYRPQGYEQLIRGKRVVVHPSYNKPYTTTLSHDIALIQLERPAKMDQSVSTVCLPDASAYVSSQSECYITGWGKIRHPGYSHHILQQAKLNPVSQMQCQKKLMSSPGGYRLRITKQMLCAGVEGTVASGCHGDSGGPFVCRDPVTRRFVLQGAVSWGSPTCTASDRYTVFARVAKFRDWIDQEMSRAQG